MKTFTRLTLLCLFLLLTSFYLKAATIGSVTITQVDTFALKGMPAQSVMKIKVTVTGTGTVNFQKLLINFANQNSSDVDSVAVYYTTSNDRFSLADYPGEATLFYNRKKIVGDSVVFNSLSYVLDPGVHYFWVTLDLSSASKASRTLSANMKANSIEIDGSLYPSTAFTPTKPVTIYDVYFLDNFEKKNTSNEPYGWDQEAVSSSPVRWISQNGGYGLSIANHPSAAKSGKLNAMLYRANNYKTKLVSKAIDLSLASRPLLTFYHSQMAWTLGGVTSSDELRVYYKVGVAGSWVALDSFNLATDSWVKREIYFPEGVTPSNLYLGFEGETKYGWGVCLDSICIYETKIVAREMKEVVVTNPDTESVPQGSTGNTIARVNVRVKGNTGSVVLNSMKISSNNTSDADIAANGVKLFYTSDSVFLEPVQIGTAQSFSGGAATFTGLTNVMETGDNYFWVTYDLKTTAIPGHIIDAKVNAGDIVLSGVTGVFPSADASPAGSRLVKQSIFFDNFDGTSSWNLSGEFEIAAPGGKGGTVNGHPDPALAYSGAKVLGTDLTGLGSNHGDYESNLTPGSAYTATSAMISARYYKNVELSFERYLNLDFLDTAAIEYKLNGSSVWNPIWTSANFYTESGWGKVNYSGLSYLNRKKFQLRFRLGGTDAIDVYSGWNIDDVFFTADSIPFDAAVSRIVGPVSACGHTSAESVTVVVRNDGPNPLVNTPVKLSLDGGVSYISETIASTIAVDDSVTYTFTTPIDLSKAAIYSILVKTAYPGDNYPDNDSIVQSVVAYPTYKLPYTTGFEQDTTFWFSSGVNSSWFQGRPSGSVINWAANGVKCWKTDQSGYNNLNEYSYLTGPCFSFSNATLPMVDLQFNHNTAPNKDGAIMQYSLDQGQNWNYVGKDPYSYVWNWYNGAISSLSTIGWTDRTLDAGGNQEWRQGRQILPVATANQNLVMFRFVYKTDPSTVTRYEGFALDDLLIRESPMDAGIDTITGLSDPACQYENSPYLNVVIKNFGPRQMVLGDSVIIGASVNNVIQVTDTLVLTSALSVNAKLNYTLKKPVDFSETGSYVIKAFTMSDLGGSIYGSDNDTAFIKLTVHQNPVTGLPDSMFSARLDTMQIIAIDSANYKYYWQASSTAGTHIYSDVTTEGNYTLIAQNATTLCQTKDTVVVKALIPDVAMEQILSPFTDCGFKSPFYPIIRLKNNGTDTLSVNAVIPIHIQLDANGVLIDNLTLHKVLAPDSSLVDTLGTSLDLSLAKTYSLKIYTQMPYDITTINDTAKISFQVYGYPTVDLGAAYVSVSDTSYLLSVPAGYSSYLWNTDSTTRFNTVKKTGWYKVTVTDSHICPAKDSIYVFLKIRDIKPIKLVSPVSSCVKTGLSNVTFRLLNAGSDTIQVNESIDFSYRFNGGATVTENFVPTSQIKPGDSIDYTFVTTEDLTGNGNYNFNVRVLSNSVTDFYPANDSALFIAHTYGLPVPDLGTAAASLSALEWTLDPGIGYASYVWQDGSTDTTYIISKNHNSGDDRYRVAVTDIHGCSATSIWYTRVLIITDIAVSSITTPVTSCALTDKEPVKIKVTNVGNTPIQSSKIVFLKYQINGGAFSATDTLNLGGATFALNQVISHTFKQLADLSQIKNYQLKVQVEYDQDINLANDTLSQLVSVYGSPTVNLGATNDTLIVDCPYTLDAGSGFSSYLWNTNELGQTISATIPGIYTVTVKDSIGCIATKAVTVIESLFDLGITGFNIPLQNCTLTTTETIAVEVQNSGSSPLVNQAFTLSYFLNGLINKSQPFSFTGVKGSKVIFTFTDKEDFSAKTIHNLDFTLTATGDEITSNNEHLYNITVSGYPSVDFGAIRDTIRTSIFPYILDAGYGYSYLWQDNSTNQTFSAPGQGLYSVKVTNSSECSTSQSVYLKNSLSTGKVSDKADVKIFPNPATDYIWVQLNLKFLGDAVMELISTDGKIIKRSALEGKLEYLEQVKVGDLAKGLYYVKIYGKDWLVTEKVLVQ